jgi:hypothetical protein
MNASDRLAIDKQLSTLDVDNLFPVASAALAQCSDLECQNDVLQSALHRTSLQIPKKVGEGARFALGLGAGATTGLVRGALGDLWGRVATLVPLVSGLTLGIASKDASYKAAGYAIALGTSAAEGGIEAYELGQILRAKMLTPVARGQTVATAPGQ